MDKSDLKKIFLEFVDYREKMAIILDEHCQVLDHKKAEDSGTKNTEKAVTLNAEVLDTTLEQASLEVAAIRSLTVIDRGSEMEDRRTRVALESSLRGS
jgi:hypothetical protein